MNQATPGQVDSFQPVEIDELDARLIETASRKNIPTLTATSAAQKPVAVHDERSPSKPLTIDVPDYLRIALKVHAAKKMVSVRYLVLTALLAQGFDIQTSDMIEDGRRLR